MTSAEGPGRHPARPVRPERIPAKRGRRARHGTARCSLNAEGNHAVAVTTWSGPERPASKRASHVPAVHEAQQRSFPGHREALGHAPPGGYQSPHGYDPDALVATPHRPVEAALQDHEGSRFSLGIRKDVSGTEPTNMASSLIQGHAEHRTRMRNNVQQPPVRAENPIRGCEQRSCDVGDPAVMITDHVPAVRLPPDHEGD